MARVAKRSLWFPFYPFLLFTALTICSFLTPEEPAWLVEIGIGSMLLASASAFLAGWHTFRRKKRYPSWVAPICCCVGILILAYLLAFFYILYLLSRFD
jgi:hypothetical protein